MRVSKNSSEGGVRTVMLGVDSKKNGFMDVKTCESRVNQLQMRGLKCPCECTHECVYFLLILLKFCDSVNQKTQLN